MDDDDDDQEYLDRNKRLSTLSTLRKKTILMYDEGKYEESAKYADEFLKLDPENELLYHYRGASIAHLGKYEEAINFYNLSRKLHPTNSSIYNNIGLAKIHLGMYEEALNDLNEAIKLHPLLEFAYKTRGLYHIHIEQYDEAIKDFNISITHNPKLQSSWYYKGYALMILKKFKEAEICFNKGVTINLNDSFSLQGKALLCLLQQDLVTAQHYFNQSELNLNKLSYANTCELYFFKAKLLLHFEMLDLADQAVVQASNYIPALQIKETLKLMRMYSRLRNHSQFIEISYLTSIKREI